MKKLTMKKICDALEALGYDDEEVLNELKAELNKGAEEKAARDAAYAGIHDIIVDNLTDTPVTAGDLWNEIADEVTAKGMSKGQVQHALTHLWQDEIEIVPGKPNTYKRR